MISKSKFAGTWDVTCDRCSVEYIEIEVDGFRDVVKELKSLGWSIQKDENDEWVHTCLDCGLME